MKRIGAILVLSLVMMLAGSTIVMAAGFEVSETSPKNGATGQSVDNMGFKVKFNKDVYSKKNESFNAAKCHLLDNKGKSVPHRVAFNSEEQNEMLVVAETSSNAKKKAKIKSKTKYTLVIDEGFRAADGSTLDSFQTSFTTLNQKNSMRISMAMMGVMVVGMIFMTSRETKRQAKEDQEAARRAMPLNPYKEAKRTGKTVEQVVAEQKKKQEKEAAKAKAREEKRARHKKENKTEISSDNMRVPGPRPISAAGSTYRYTVSKPEPPKKSKSTNPKNRSGKQKNQKNRNKKKH